MKTREDSYTISQGTAEQLRHLFDQLMAELRARPRRFPDGIRWSLTPRLGCSGFATLIRNSDRS